MNKIKKIIMTIVLLSSSSLGNLSKGQLLELAEMSWVLQSFRLTQDERYTHLFNKFNIDRNTTNLEIIEKIKKYAYCTESFNAFLDEISKLSTEEYTDIIAFYQTDVGKKLVKEILILDKTKVNQIYQKLEKNKKISEERVLLTISILKEFNQVNLQVDYELYKLLIEKIFDDKNPKYSYKSLKKYKIKIKNILEKQLKQNSIVLFKEFTINELKRVLQYAKTQSGKREWEVLFKGLKESNKYQIFSCGKYYYKLENLTSTSQLKN